MLQFKAVMKTHFSVFNPIPTYSLLKNIVGKGENVSYGYFLLFPISTISHLPFANTLDLNHAKMLLCDRVEAHIFAF